MKDKFLNGYVLGTGITCIVMSLLLSISTVTISSHKKITPEVRITINGEKIDTIYKYKKQ
jgi:hypothetical protein